MNKETIIMGIDPGTIIMGFGIVSLTGDKIKLIRFDELMMGKLANHQMKLKKIFERTLALIDEYHPDEVAIEAPFFGKNVQSMLKLGRAQGTAMAAALYRDIPIVEYAPKKIKSAITGNGNASKEQVAGTLQNILKFKEMPKNLDATDGLAAAVCHCFNRNSITTTGSSYSGWSSYINKNPKRVK